jgi:hypothetical protein
VIAKSLMPPSVATYVGEVVRRLHNTLDGQLHAAYVIGSLAGGNYVAGQSDIDMLAVSQTPLADKTKLRIISALSHPNLPCPARGLEFVLYGQAAAAVPNLSPHFEINLNTGPGMEHRFSFEPESEPSHWFVLDIAIARQRAIELVGPSVIKVFAPVSRGLILDSLLESLDWHAEHESLTHYSVLNACRSWRFAEEGVWDTKGGAAAWARPRVDDPSLIDAAIAIRNGADRPALDREEIRSLVQLVRARVLALSRLSSIVG